MKKVNFDTFYKSLRGKTVTRVRLENEFTKRTCRQRPRDPKKEELLTMLDKERWKKAILSGDIRKISRRESVIIL